MKTRISSLLISTLICSSPAVAEWSGNFSLQNRYFFHSPLPLIEDSSQEQYYPSVSSEVEYYTDWDNQDRSITIKGFLRLDQYDVERTHGDLREFYYQYVFTDWELRMGISKVYWGVTEAQHLVDIINQNDAVENIDNEDKLGQPMFMLSRELDSGTVNVFVLPYFRERTFKGIDGRPATTSFIDSNFASYESSKEQKHIDYAARWFSYLDDLEYGLSVFSGTSREPVLLPRIINSNNTLTPYYPQMTQFALDAQLTTEEWLYKLELIHRDWQQFDFNQFKLVDTRFTALTAGFEYTIVGIMQSYADLGIVMEYLYDDRDHESTNLFQNDVMLGLRLAMNDSDSSEALLGIIYDMDYYERAVSLEAKRRFMGNWTAELEARFFSNTNSQSITHGLRHEDFLQLDLSYHF